MKEIGVAFAISSVAAIVLMQIHPGLSSAAFAALFPTVLAYLERAQNRRLRNAAEGPPASRGTEDQSETEAQTDVQPIPVVPSDATMRSGIDWRPVIIGTLIATPLVGLTATFGFILAIGIAILADTGAVLVLPLAVAVLCLFGTGYWVAKRSAGNGALNASVMGSIVGVGLTFLFLALSDSMEVGEFVYMSLVFTGSAVVFASVGGWLGARRRTR